MTAHCTKMDFSDGVRDFVASNFLSGADETPQDDTSFLDTGTVDSWGVLELVMFLEKTYNLRISADEIIPDNLGSINRIARFVTSKLSVEAEKSFFELAARPAGATNSGP